MTVLRLFNRPLVAALALLPLLPRPAAAQFPPDSFTNLKVLPRNIRADSLVPLMASFTRALGVRCTYCHVGEESKPLETYDFASDEKLPKRKARTMLRMLAVINDTALQSLESRITPPLAVECATCHRGTTQPRMIQDVLLAAWRAGGIDSTLSTYNNLRSRYYGRFTYDFGEVPLVNVATQLLRQGRMDDAERLYALNVEMNPNSVFAKQQHATQILMALFRQDPAAGRRRYAELQKQYGAPPVGAGLLNDIGYQFLGGRTPAVAIEVFKLATEAFPQLANTWDSLGEGYAANGKVDLAIASYQHALQLDPSSTNAAQKIAELKKRRGGKDSIGPSWHSFLPSRAHMPTAQPGID